MSSACSVIKSIEQTLQGIANFLTNPSSLTTTAANNLIIQIELIKGAVRELPLAAGPKFDILNRLTQAQTILQNGTLGLSTTDRLLAILSILQVVALKVQNRKLPCPQGFVTVQPSCPFNTITTCF